MKTYRLLSALLLLHLLILFLVASFVVPMSFNFMLPARSGHGIDYHSVYGYVHAFLTGRNAYAIPGNIDVYPPFVTLFFVPWSIFPFSVSYAIQIALLFTANVSAIYVCVRMFENADFVHAHDRSVLWFLFCIFEISSYGFMFSVERGNYDSFALLFACLSVFYLQKNKSTKNMVIAALFMSMAIQLKIYPLILFPLIIYRYRTKGFLVLLGSNLALILCLGPAAAIAFIHNLVKFSSHPTAWVANHSAVSFGLQISRAIGVSDKRVKLVIVLLFWASPIALWALMNLGLLRRRSGSVENYFVSSTFLMCFVPPTSYDYTLVLMIVPLLYVYPLLFNSTIPRRLKAVLVVPYSIFISAIVLPYWSDRWYQNKYLPLALLMAVCGYAFYATRGERLPNPRSRGME